MEDEEEDVSNYWIALMKRKTVERYKEAIDLAMWRTDFGRAYGPVVR